MIKCTYCGADLEDNSEFCGICGNSVEAPKARLFVPNPEDIELATQSWTTEVGVERVLNLNGKKFTVTADRDKFNSFRKKFIRLAKYCSDRAAEDYIEKISDLRSFFDCFHNEIYIKYARVLADKVTDVLVAENIYTVTDDMVISVYENTELKTPEIAQALADAVEATYQANNQIANTFMGLAGSFIGSRSDLGGEVFGAMQGGLVEGASKLSDAQQKELFASIDLPDLFNRVNEDYESFVIMLVDFLNLSGVDSWKPKDEHIQELDNILKNLSNPNFPQDKITDIVINMIFQKPYKPEIYSFLQKKYPDSEEVKRIVEYFGFEDYKCFAYTEEDFPEPQPVVPEVSPASEPQTETKQEAEKKIEPEPEAETYSQPKEQGVAAPNNSTPAFGGFKKLGEKIDQGIGKAESFLNKFGKK